MTFQPPYRPSGRSVWLGKDIVQTDDWIVRLSPATLEEIDASVSRFRGRNAYDAPVARDEFPLTTMAEDLARMRREIATGRGFFVFRGLDRDRYCDNELGLIFRGFGAHFGHDLTQSAFGDRLGDIRDISDILVDRSKRRGYQSGGFQTAHTDPSGEVGIVAMLSLKMAMSGGESLIASAHTVHNMLLDWCPDLLGEFYKGFVLRRPESDAERMGRSALIGNVELLLRKRLAQLRLPACLYAPRRGARRHDHQPETGSRARCFHGHLQPSRRYAEDDARARRLPVHQQPHDPARPGSLRGS